MGWRGYLLPVLRRSMSLRRAVIVSGILWGIGHAPLVYLVGLNYGLHYPGYPWTGMIMMILLTTALGVWLSYLTVRTGSVIAVSIAHGAFNAVRELPLFVAIPTVNTLLGPKASGIIGGIVLYMVALYYWRKLASIKQPVS
jgi:membrane protease YdiL (CAAX protease family)